MLSNRVQVLELTIEQAFYHFFRDNVVVAWRLCGVAGRFCMELGLHDDDAAAGTGDHRKICGIIISSIIVLDRQWSASSGLPIHFPNGQFHKKLVSEVCKADSASVNILTSATGRSTVPQINALLLSNERESSRAHNYGCQRRDLPRRRDLRYQ